MHKSKEYTMCYSENDERFINYPNILRIGLKVIKSFTILTFIIFIIGCDSVHDMKNSIENKDLMEAEIKSKYGWQSLIGIKIDNGNLKHVTLVLDANEIRNENVIHLENIAKEITLKYFKLKPEVIYIQIATLPDDNS